MKNRLLTSFIMLCTLFLASCGDYYSVDVAPGTGVEATLIVSPEQEITLPAEDATATVEITTNMEDKYVTYAINTAAQSWCSAELDGNIITITLEDNAAYASRAAVLTIKSFDKKTEIAITQEAKVFVPTPDVNVDGVFKVAVPTIADFDKSKIYIVRDEDGGKIAEICLEYLGVENGNRAVVIYPSGGAEANYENGLLAYYVDESTLEPDASKATCGGRLTIDYSVNSYIYVDGDQAPLTEFYISSDGVAATTDDTAEDLTAEPYTVKDMNGNEYPVVKIGGDVWLGANLRATKLSDGSDVTIVEDASQAGSYVDVPAVCYPNNDSSISLEEYGFLYNANTLVMKSAELVSSIEDDCTWRMSTGGTGMVGFNTDWERLFKFIGDGNLSAILTPGYTWKASAYDGKATNITGFSATPAGENYDNGVIGGLAFNVSCFPFYGLDGNGYNLADDASSPEFAGVRPWTHQKDWCTIRLVRDDKRDGADE